MGRLDAVDIDLDFLEILRGALSERGLVYDVVSMQQESDVEGPAFTGDPFGGTLDAGRDVRLTVSDVIMMRRGSGVRIADSGGASTVTASTSRWPALGFRSFAATHGQMWPSGAHV